MLQAAWRLKNKNRVHNVWQHCSVLQLARRFISASDADCLRYWW